MRFHEGGTSYGKVELATMNEQALALVVANIDVKEEIVDLREQKIKALQRSQVTYW